MATNDVTGDEIRTRAPSDKFRENWDAIFGKRGEKEQSEDKEPEGE